MCHFLFSKLTAPKLLHTSHGFVRCERIEAWRELGGGTSATTRRWGAFMLHVVVVAIIVFSAALAKIDLLLLLRYGAQPGFVARMLPQLSVPSIMARSDSRSSRQAGRLCVCMQWMENNQSQLKVPYAIDRRYFWPSLASERANTLLITQLAATGNGKSFIESATQFVCIFKLSYNLPKITK